MAGTLATDAPAAGPWVVRWLSADRLRPHLTATGDEPEAALRLYEWNASVSAAMMHDLGHLEVALRNAYDRAIRSVWTGPGHWTRHRHQLFAPEMRRRKGVFVDINRRPRAALAQAIENAGGQTAPPGKAIAELMFGFWRYLTSKAHEKSLWVPYLHHAFPRGTDRQRDVDQRVGRLHELRNRAVHHEPLLSADLQGGCRDLLAGAELLDVNLHGFILATSTVTQLLAARPAA